LATPVVLYDWAHPQQQHFASLTKLLRKRLDLYKRFLAFHSRFHLELALQRRAIKDKIDEALTRNCLSTPYTFTRWQRTIRWRYSDHPLCTAGSLIAGGRFNTGENIDPSTFPPFSAFYVANDKDTALQEALGQEASGTNLNAHQLALANPDSVLTFSVSGQLDHVLDLHDASSLRAFVDLIKHFTVPSILIREARHLPVRPPAVITTAADLLKSLLNPNWRHVGVLCEVPANSQIFGQIVMLAGIEGILYPSKLSGKDCLAIFPSNFVGKSSFIQLDDRVPDSLLGPVRIDGTNWEACERTVEEMRNSPLRRAASP
jgi:RES domain-containing protein